MSAHARPAFIGLWRHVLRGLSLLREFIADRRGNILILFGLSLIPLAGVTGVALDYAFANQGRTQMQAALDITALTLSKMMPLDQAALDTKGRQIFLANLGKTPLTIKASNVADQLTITPAVGKLTLAVNTDYPIRMAGVLGHFIPAEIPIGSRTEVVWGQGKVEVALALDNTGSMGGTKIEQLIAASNNMIEILKNAAQNPGDAKVAIVPFGFQTRVDPATYRTASWLRWDLWEAQNGNCSVSGGTNQGVCGAAHCSSTRFDDQNSCTSNGKTWHQAGVGVWTPKDHSIWNGCIADRDKDPSLNYDANDTSVDTGVLATKFPAAQDCGSLATVMPLNYNWGDTNSIDSSTLHGKINSMNAVGNTNVTIGLHWAFQMLSPTGTLPFSQGAAYGTENLTKYLIILTDGDNTQNRWTSTQSLIDPRTTAACDAVKARGIKIYSIRVIDGNEDLLRNCATDPSMYFSVTDASQLQGVFNVIGTTIANLHLSM
jgi:Flp pilus assembly protein TadG